MSDAALEERAAEASETVDLVLSEFMPYRIVALGHLISRRLARAYENENLTIPEWRVLAVVSQESAVAARDVVARTPMDKMAVSRAVASLETKGLVARRAHPEDRRVAALQLSSAGRALFARVARLATAYEARLLSALTAEEQAALKSALARLEAGAASDT